MRKKQRVIDILRSHYPGQWKYVDPGRWEGPFTVQAYSESAARCDAEIDTRFMTTYRNVETGEIIDELLIKCKTYVI